MKLFKYLKYLFVFLLTFLLGIQTTYAKTRLVLSQPQVSFSIEHSQKTNSLKKDLQPNIGFLIEKTRFEVSEGFSAQDQHEFSGIVVRNLADAVDDVLAQRKSFWNNWINKCFPERDWTRTKFITKGKNYASFKSSNTSIYNDMKVLNSSEIKLQEFIESGSTIPVEITLNQGDKFYKIVSKGNNIGGPSVYYLDEIQLNLIKTNSESLEQMLGLPLNSVSKEYDVFKITYQGSGGSVYKSTVANTEQYAITTPTIKYKTSGGATQILILDNMDASKWIKSTTPIENITPNKLPLIDN